MNVWNSSIIFKTYDEDFMKIISYDNEFPKISIDWGNKV